MKLLCVACCMMIFPDRYVVAQAPFAFTEATVTLEQVHPGYLPDVSHLTDGSFSGVYPESKITYKGTVKRNQLHGPWESRFPDQSLFEQGGFARGMPDGQWIVRYESGKPRYYREFSAAKWERVQQEWIRPHPRFPLLPLSVLHQKDPGRASAFLQDNIEFPTNGMAGTYRPPFSGGLLHGSYLNYDEKGKVLDSGYYANGLRTGVWKESIRQSEVAWIGSYVKGLRDGNWKCVNGQSRIISLVLYKQGKLIWRKDYP